MRLFQRRDRDSNPGTHKMGQRFSRPPRSTTPASLLVPRFNELCFSRIGTAKVHFFFDLQAKKRKKISKTLINKKIKKNDRRFFTVVERKSPDVMPKTGQNPALSMQKTTCFGKNKKIMYLCRKSRHCDYTAKKLNTKHLCKF